MWPPSASYCRRRSPLVEKTVEASRRRPRYKTTGSATPCSKIQGRQGCTAAPAPTSARGCSHRPAPPCRPSSHPSTRRRTPQRRDGSTGPSEGQSPKPLTNRRKDGRLRNRVGVEVMQLHPVVVQERPHEAARSHSKPPLMEGDETDHVPRRWSQVGLAPGGHPLRLRLAGERTEQTVGNKGLQILHSNGGERPWVTRQNDVHLVSHRRTKVVEAEGMRCAVFSVYSLRLRKQKQKASANGMVKNHHRPLFRVYKGPSEIHPKLRPNPLRNSNSKVKRFFYSSNDSRTRNRCPANHPSHRINSLAGQTTPLAGEAGAVSPPS
jgi:hypothetical protein